MNYLDFDLNLTEESTLMELEELMEQLIEDERDDFVLDELQKDIDELTEEIENAYNIAQVESKLEPWEGCAQC
jgi:hypothetical protein